MLDWKLFWCDANKRPLCRWKTQAVSGGVEALDRVRPKGELIGAVIPEGYIVLDVDVKDGRNGRQTLAKLEERLGPLPTTRTHRTRSGGLHLIFRGVGKQVNDGSLGEGLDTRVGGKGFIVVPPSEGYKVVQDVEPAELPPAWGEYLADGRDDGQRPAAGATIDPRLWPVGHRDCLATALAGFLYKLGLTDATRLRVSLTKIALAAGDEEAAMRGKKADYLVARLREGAIDVDAISGWTKLTSILGEDTAKELATVACKTAFGPWYGSVKRGTNVVQALDAIGQRGALADLAFGADGVYYQWEGNYWRADMDKRRLVSWLAQRFNEAMAFDPKRNPKALAESAWDMLVGNQGWYGCAPTPQQAQGKLWFTNGVLDLGTGRLLPHGKEHGLAPRVGVAYREADRHPSKTLAFLKHLNESFADVIEAWIWQAIHGYNPAQVMLHLIGEGGTGKSTFMEYMRLVVPDFAVMAVHPGRFDRWKLLGARLVLFPDVSRYEGDVAFIKNITGGDVITIEKKHHDAVQFMFEGNVLATSNEPIVASDTTGAWRRRYLPIRCDNVIKDAQPGYAKAVLAEEIPCFIKYLLDKWNEADVVARLRSPGVDPLDQDESSVGVWIRDCVRVTNDEMDVVSLRGSTKLAAIGVCEDDSLFGSYTQYCRACGHKPLNYNNFSKRAKGLLVAIGWGGDWGRVKKLDGVVRRVATGIKLAPDE